MIQFVNTETTNRPIFYYIITFFFLIIRSGQADFITLIQADKCETIIEIRIQEEEVRITFEIGEKDAEWFHNIIPTNYYKEGYTENNALKSHKSFYQNDFVLTANGKKLNGQIQKTDFIKRTPRSSLYTGKVDTTSQASKHVVYVEIIYKFETKPAIISITPPLREGYSTTFANIGFVTYHKKIPINDIRYLGKKETIHLDWNDPWYSFFENKNIRRHHNSSIMSFLYIDPYEVRHEILARIKDLEHWIDFDYQIDDYIEIAEQDSLKNKIARFLKNRNKVLVDSVESEPIIDKIHFVEVALSGIRIMEQPGRMDYSSAIIGVIFAYPNPGIPQQVTIDWDLFCEQIANVTNTATDPAGPMQYIMSPDDNILVWQNFLKKYKLPTISEVNVTNATMPIPWISLFIISAILAFTVRKKHNIKNIIRKKWWAFLLILLAFLIFLPVQYDLEIPFWKKEMFSVPEAKGLVSQLLKNTYRAFDFRSESDIYDKLAISNEGELLSDVYLQTKKSMVIENQGGIEAKVKVVNVVDVAEVDSDKPGLTYECHWRVGGTVGHWGHIHRRTNQYRAIVNIIPVNGVWKMYDLDIIEEIRL
jgi:hypothetical protein